jgi:hypothetical protein
LDDERNWQGKQKNCETKHEPLQKERALEASSSYPSTSCDWEHNQSPRKHIGKKIDAENDYTNQDQVNKWIPAQRN